MLPAELEDGTWLWPVGALGRDEILLIAQARRPAFFGFDTRTKSRRLLARAPEWASCGGCFEIQKTAIGADLIAVIVKGYAPDATTGGKRHYEIWTMPRTGGAMRMAVRLPENLQAEEAYVDGFQIVGNTAVWWGIDSDIWRVPLAGGTPEQVRPGDRAHVSSWPWAHDAAAKTIIHLGTGEEIDVDATGHPLACDSVWCVGADGRSDEVVVLKADGGGRVTVPGTVLMFKPPIHNRLVLLRMPGRQYGGSFGGSALGAIVQLYDICTRRQAFLGSATLARAELPWDAIRLGAHTPEGPIVYWRAGGNRFVVVDLARITAHPCAS
ncbi:hypothetical protein HII36_46500 [Nonomuraea sp. NN258]|uniref:hypothetical protein n=1 Tax=Nonomuraea antri TaxID=2730852 RepID=UPI001567ECBD|nr:hypothetical protein [Nonomuraea antri]NRQ39225.1 hypothetical protein [Nonomuraea antri]